MGFKDQEYLWEINPYTLSRLFDYISSMPKAFREELIQETEIHWRNSPCPFTTNHYIEWLEGALANDIINKDSWKITPSNFPAQEGESTEDYLQLYNLLFFFSAFRRNPEQASREVVGDWMEGCIVDTLKYKPSITPYSSEFVGRTPTANSGRRMRIAKQCVVKHFASMNLGLTTTHIGFTTAGRSRSPLELMTGPFYNLNLQSGDYLPSLMTAGQVGKEKWLREKGQKISELELKELRVYWSDNQNLIPTAFFSKASFPFRLLNYKLEAIHQLK